MNTFLLGVAVIGGIIAVAISGLLLVRAKCDIRQFSAHHEVGGYMLSVLGTLYAVVLGFVVVSVYESAQNIRVNIASEVNSVMNIYRLSDGFPQKNKEQIDNALLNYLTTVCNEEWINMASGKIPVSTIHAGENIWQSIKDYVPQTPQQQSFYSLLLENYSQMLNCQRIRFIGAHDQVSTLLWVVLIGGAATTIGFTFFFGLDKLGPQILMTTLVCIALGLNLLLIVIYSRPFSGDLGIRPAEFRIAAEFIRNKGRLPPKLLQLAP